MLEVQGVVKSFDDFLAVNEASLRVQRGEIVAVIGPNGAGKTTLFNLITGRLSRDLGKILASREGTSPASPPLDVLANLIVGVTLNPGRKNEAHKGIQ